MKVLLVVTILFGLAIPVEALEINAPRVPDSAAAYMPAEPENLGEGIRQVLKEGIARIRPDLREATRVCFGIGVIVVLTSLVRSVPGGMCRTTDLAAAVAISGLFLSAAESQIHLASQTVVEVSQYGKLLMPPLTAALAAQGGITTSAALYAGTMLFDGILSGIITQVLMPLVYLFLALSIAKTASGNLLLKQFRDTVKWLMTWLLKIVLYVFTGYISLTGVISGPTDAAALKAAKLTISGVVPVVGGILSDASEAILVSAGAVKNSIGLYGMFAVLAIWMDPFLKIGTHYLMLKMTAGISGIFGIKETMELIQDFSTALGYLLAMTGAVCLMLLISTVCFMRGVT